MSAEAPEKSGFRRVDQASAGLRVSVDGQSVVADPGDTVASLLLMHGHKTFRVNRPSGQARAPYCMIGVCFECLVTIDGEPEVQSCLVRVQDGMEVQTQRASART